MNNNEPILIDNVLVESNTINEEIFYSVTEDFTTFNAILISIKFSDHDEDYYWIEESLDDKI